MKALADYIVRGRWQAVLVASLSGTMSFMLPPFSTVLNYLAAATVALVTLHIGKLQGLQVLFIAAAITVVFYQLFDMQSAVVAIMIVLLWLPCWALAAVLQQTRQLDTVFKATVLFGTVLLLAVYGVYGDPVPWWVERLQTIKGLLEGAGLAVTDLSDEQLLRDVAALLTGLVLASLLIGVLSSLLLARWWQSVLVHPGGFGEEFCGLRLGHVAGLLTLCAMLASRLVSGSTGELVAQLALIMLVPYLLVGLAVILSIFLQSVGSTAWFVTVFVMLAMLPNSTVLMS